LDSLKRGKGAVFRAVIDDRLGFDFTDARQFDENFKGSGVDVDWEHILAAVDLPVSPPDSAGFCSDTTGTMTLLPS
jgi:hypothetical protein